MGGSESELRYTVKDKGAGSVWYYDEIDREVTREVSVAVALLRSSLKILRRG